MSLKTRSSGAQAEQLVADYLIKKGFEILTKNYQKFYGEIDVIASRKDLLIFVEVKMRHNPLFDSTLLITSSKQQKITQTARAYIAEHQIVDMICRFDVALITYSQQQPLIEYIENAFTSDI